MTARHLYTRRSADAVVIDVHDERPSDVDEVRALNRLAFGRPGEAALVDALRGRPGVISLVATRDGTVVGHILFSPVRIDGTGAGVNAAGLGPMAVLPAHQRAGVGSLLVREGLARCRRHPYDLVVVLGHPRFYPRFGFLPASRRGLRYEADVPDEAFMALELSAAGAAGGVVRYSPEFSGV